MNMTMVEQRIFLSADILANEYDFYYGTRKDELVTFTYLNFRTQKWSSRKENYKNALSLARSRARDKRYKNYEFLIG